MAARVVEFTTATHADVAALHDLIERAYRGDSAKAGWTHEADLLGGQRTDIAALTAMIDAPGGVILIAREAASLIGCVNIAAKDERTAYLGLLTVDPGRQAGGLGRHLLDAAATHARAAGHDAIEMTVIAQRTELIAYYERRGYALTGERRPFPLDDARFGLPRTRDLEFVVMMRAL